MPSRIHSQIMDSKYKSPTGAIINLESYRMEIDRKLKLEKNLPGPDSY